MEKLIRHREARSAAAIQTSLDCFASLAMTNSYVTPAKAGV